MNLKACYIVLMLGAATVCAGQSVLSAGNWYKLGVTESGVYKIDKSFLSNELGISTAAINPKSVKIYGKGGAMLPQENDIFRHSDPPQNAIYAFGESDGSFDDGDYFLFYGQSPHTAHLLSNGSVNHQNNYYSDTTYYFLTYGGEDGMRMANNPNPATSGTAVATFHDYIVNDPDEQNILNSGREWFSLPYTTAFGNKTEQSFTYNIPGIGDSIGAEINLLGASLFAASFDVFLNMTEAANVPVKALSSNTYTDRAYEYSAFLSQENNAAEDIRLDIIFNENRVNNQTSQGHLDYFILGFERSLALYGGQTHFRNRKTTNQNTTYNINYGDSNNFLIWKITNPTIPQNQLYATSGSTASFNQMASSQIEEYVIFDLSVPKTPKSFGKVPNQNIKSNLSADGIIVCPPPFLSEAQRLADFHQSNDALNVVIVTPQQIYNEFSSGMQDVTAIRDYFRYVWINGGEKLKYALLFGDGSYDYRWLNKRHPNNAYNSLPDQNFVPVYESRESFHKLYSHSSDDFFGFLEDGEGDWYEGDQTNTGAPILSTVHDHTLDIGIGRIPVRTIEQAEDVVNKIIRYKTPNDYTLGKWRTQVAYLADDGDGNQHMEDVEYMNDILEDESPEYNSTRLYIDNFDQIGEDQESPDLVRAINERLQEGVLVMDYLGHGGYNVLMQEEIIDMSLISELSNRHKLPLFVTATCNFGVYDDPSKVSGAEEFLLHPNGGAIALLTTTRAVYASTNKLVNAAFHESVFLRENGKHLRLGDVMRLTKNNSLRGPINRNFALLGDPMLTLNYPEYEIRFDDLETQLDTLSALEKVTITGKIYDNTTILETFNGTATITLWDIPRDKLTKGLDNPEQPKKGLPGEVNDPFEYQEQDNALYRGDVSVTSGTFETTFVLPKNSSYKYEKGRLTAYAISEESMIDASGASRNLVLGGTASTEADDTPPVIIETYINEPDFKNGDVVGPSSLFVARVSDESGINISANGFNQSLTLTLNDTLIVSLNDYYTATKDDYTSGSIVYPIKNFDKGTYKGQLKIWDTHNNYSTKYVEFKVSDQPKIRLFNAMNYPNPVSDSGETTFTFKHDRQGEALVVKISVYDLMGSKASEWIYELDDVTDTVDNLTRLLTNQNGERLDKGVYFYKLQVTSTLDGASNQVINRLIINN